MTGSVAAGGSLFYALQPQRKAASEELYTTASHETPDALQGVPEDYVQIPKLGPPLPGDLGRLIAFAQARRVDAASPAIGGGTVRRNPDAARANAAEVARQRVRQENDSAHQQALPCIIWIQSK